MQAQSADGVLHDFPDGTDPAVIDRVMKGYASQNQPSAQPAPRPGRDAPQYTRDAPSSFSSDVGNTLGRIAPKANDQIGATVGRALDVVPYFADRAMGGEGVHPFENTYKRYFGSHQDNPIVGKSDLPPPASAAQEYADAGGRMLGENLPFIGGAGVLSKGVRLATDAAPTIGNAAKSGYNSIMDAIAAKPVASTLGEAAASVESGGIGELARQTAAEKGAGPEGQQAAEMVGQMGGPTAMVAYPTVLAAKAASKVAGPLVSGAAKVAGTVAEALPEGIGGSIAERLRQGSAAKNAASANSTVSSELADVAQKPEAQAGIQQTQQLEQEIPGFKPGIAKATNDPVLLNTQQKLNQEATGPELRQSQEAYDANAQSLRDKFKSLAPTVEAPKSASFVGPMPPAENAADVVHGAEAARVQGVQDRIAGVQQKVGEQQTATQQKLQAAGEALPAADRADQGAKFRDIHDTAAQASDAKTTELRNAVPQNAPVEVAPAKPSEVSGPGYNVGGAPAETMSAKDLLDRRASINQQLRQYQSASSRTVDDVKSMQALQAERDKLDAAVSKSELPGMQQYRDYYRDEHVPKFEEGAGRDVSRYDRFGYDKNKVPDEKVLAQFGGPNNISAAKQFTATHGGNPEAVQLMADHQLGRLKAAALDETGAIKDGAVDKFLKQNKELLDALPPEVRQAVASKNPTDMYKRLGDLETRQRKLADMKVQSTLGKDPENTINGALNDWQVMRDLKKSMGGNPQHETALTRAVMDTAPDPTNAKAFGEWLQGHDRSLRQVLSPQHLTDLKNIAAASEVHGRLPRPQGSVELPKSLGGAIGEKTGVTIPSAIGSVLSIARGRTSPLTEIPSQGVKMAGRLNERAVNAAWREALSNPDIARSLGTVMKGGTATPMQIDKLHTYLLSSGLLAAEGQDNSQQQK